MKLNLSKPLAFFDLETTGVSITKDRIVEISILKIHPNGDEEIKTRRINPGMPIPESSSLIHGIYDKDVKDEPEFNQVAKSLNDFLAGCDLGGYNLVRFDVPFIIEEFIRAGIDFSIDNRRIIDAQRIFYMMQPRTLSAAYEFFCDKSLENAHSAEADTIATYEVLKGQLDKYSGAKIKTKEGELIEPVINDMDALHKISISNAVDLAGRIVFNEDGKEVINFGKHKDKLVTEVFKKEPAYYDWMMRGDFPQQTKNILTKIKLRGFNQ